MFLQFFTMRVAVTITVLMIGVTGIAYSVGHLSDQPVIIAYVAHSAIDQTLYGYLVDPIRRFHVPIEIPPELTSSSYFRASNEPNHIFMSKNAINTDNGSNVRRLYRYNFRTQDITTVYETEFGEHIPSAPDRAFEFNGYYDTDHYIIVDKLRHAIVIVNRKSLNQRVLWQGAKLADQPLDYTLTISPSPSGDKYAVLDSSENSNIVVVSRSGEMISQFQTIDYPQHFVVWLDNQYLMVTPAGVQFQLETKFGIYDITTGQANPFTESLAVTDAQPIIGCEDQGPWIGYITPIGDNEFQAFTMNLASGATYEQAAFKTPIVFFGQPPMPPSYGCTILLQVILLTSDEGMRDVYRTTLTGDGLEQILSDVIPGSFIDEHTFTYARQNETSSYDLYALSFDDFTTELLFSDLPTTDALWTRNLLERGWYVFRDDQWNRTPEQFPRISGNPLLYYDIHSRDVHVLTPPDVRIQWFTGVR